MLKYEYLNIENTSTDIESFMSIIKGFGEVGWKFVTVFNGWIIFERKMKVKQKI